TAAFFGISVILFVLATFQESDMNSIIIKIISVTLFVCMLISLIIAKGHHFSWIMFLAASFLAWIGS
ncbi:hypothetical protein ACFL7D_10040, partial [candidate division KSB1 bacterium]